MNDDGIIRYLRNSQAFACFYVACIHCYEHGERLLKSKAEVLLDHTLIPGQNQVCRMLLHLLML
jgi:hypothetical protein